MVKFGQKHNIYTKFQDISTTKPPEFHIPGHISGQEKISGHFQDFWNFQDVWTLCPGIHDKSRIKIFKFDCYFIETFFSKPSFLFDSSTRCVFIVQFQLISTKSFGVFSRGGGSKGTLESNDLTTQTIQPSSIQISGFCFCYATLQYLKNVFNPFHAVPFLYPLILSQNQRFSDISRGYRNKTLP